MRFYDIQITDPTNGALIRQYTSWIYRSPTGPLTNTSALNIEMDVPVTYMAQPLGKAWLRLWGIPLQEIGNAADLVGKIVVVSAGMKPGLPLANQRQSGVIMRGLVYQCFGNWIGSDMTLDMFIYPSGLGAPQTTAATMAGRLSDAPAPTEINILLDWRKGQSMAEAVQSSLTAAFAQYGYKIDVNITPSVVAPVDQPGHYFSLASFALWLKQKSQALVTANNYLGVDILVSNGRLTVYDNLTHLPPPKQIEFKDLIGQPTWVEPTVIQFKCPIRADIGISDIVRLPVGVLATKTEASLVGSVARNNLTFNGTYRIQVIRHVGNFRQADAESWVTTFNANPVGVGGG